MVHGFRRARLPPSRGPLTLAARREPRPPGRVICVTRPVSEFRRFRIATGRGRFDNARTHARRPCAVPNVTAKENHAMSQMPPPPAPPPGYGAQPPYGNPPPPPPGYGPPAPGYGQYPQPKT